MAMTSRVTAAVLWAAVSLAPAGLTGQELGPADSDDFVGVDSGRVAVGDLAPDFTLEALGGGRVTLSDYRGRKDVVLVFYRGHW